MFISGSAIPHGCPQNIRAPLAKRRGGWLAQFPTGAEIMRKTVELRSEHGTPSDKQLLHRRECEFEIFRSVEKAIELPVLRLQPP